MQKVILIFALLAVSGFALTPYFDELNFMWGTWKTLHGKSYAPGEESARYAIFVDNFAKISKYNAQQSSVKLRLNEFADMTAEEFKHKKSGCARVEDNVDIIRENTIPYEFDLIEVPTSVDWRTKGAVTAVKNQGQCGSCWTFSATGVLEGYYFVKNGKLLSFSEQQIVDCANSAGYGCSGGWPYLAIQYAASAGLETESDYPYSAKDQTCKYNKNLAVHTNNGYSFVTNYNVDALKAAIVSMPVSVLIEADQQVFQFYSSGVVQANSGCGDSLDHAVLAVGYGTVSGTDAFIVKNSWGNSWGQAGYVYISTDAKANGGAGVCGILSQPTIPN